MYKILNVGETRKQRNPRYKYTTTKTMYDVCAHSSLPTSAIIVLGLLKKMMKNFAWAAKNTFKMAFQEHILAVVKGCYQCGDYCKECLYCQNSLKV